MTLSRVSPTRSVSVPTWLLPVLVAVGAMLGGAAVYARTSGYGVPRAETGTVTMVNDERTAMGFMPDGANDSHMLYLGITDRPDCLRVGSHVELAIVNVRNGNVRGEDLVVDVRCLG
jgi:hypothetical protein